MPNLDVTVVIDVLHPATTEGQLSRPLLLVAGTTASYKEYANLTALTVDYGTTTPTYKLAQTIDEQDYAPDAYCVATYVGETPAEGQSLAEVIQKYYNKSWHFALLVDGTAAERLLLSQTIEPHDFKFSGVLVPDKAELASYKDKKRTIPFYHTIDGERLDGAAIGEIAAREIGSVTWHNMPLKGITPLELSKDERDAIVEAGGNVFVKNAGYNVLSGGIVADGEYIDFYHGKDWIKANIENDLQKMLIENDKVPAGPAGVSLSSNVVTSKLTEAGKQGIIDQDADTGEYSYTLIAAPFTDGTSADIAKRIYSGLSFKYDPQNAIHAINVHGEVASNK